MSTWAIGDIQGCYKALQTLLKHIDFKADRDQLWFVGDLVNRGPDSLSVLRFVRDLGDNAITVLGNHDLHLLAIANGNPKHDKCDPGMAAVLGAKDRDRLLDWLQHRPLIHYDAQLDFAMVHAGISPQWDLDMALSAGQELHDLLSGEQTSHYFKHMYGNRPETWSDKLTGMERQRYITNVFTRMRYLHSDGRMDHEYKKSPKQAPKELMPWFALDGPAQQQTRIVFGHWSTLGDYQGHKVWATDTGCLWGGKLTALKLCKQPKRYSVACESIRKPGKAK